MSNTRPSLASDLDTHLALIDPVGFAASDPDRARDFYHAISERRLFAECICRTKRLNGPNPEMVEPTPAPFERY